mgnify:CR=1 FL=1
MILINLLPHREEARKRRRELFYISLGASVLAGALVAGGIYLWEVTQVSMQQARNATLQAEIKKLEGQIKDIANLQQEINALRARQQAVENLQREQGVATLWATHLVEEVEHAQRVVVLHQGRLRHEGSVASLREVTGQGSLQQAFLALTRA